jgi:hypothetical protein
MCSLDRDVLCSMNRLVFHNYILPVKHLNSESESYSGAHVKIIFFPLALQPQFGPWPTSMKLSVSLQFSRS